MGFSTILIIAQDMISTWSLKKEYKMGILWVILIVVFWVVLQIYILPKLGVST
jgi:hypothetical protein